MKSKINLGSLPGSNGVGNISKFAQEILFMICENIGTPFISATGPANAYISRLVINPLAGIALIFSARNFAEITQAIIFPVMIDMIDFIFGKSPIQPKPYEAMGQIGVFTHIDSNIPRAVWSTSNVSHFGLTTSIFKPSKMTRFWIIVQKLFESILGNHDFSPIEVSERNKWGATIRRYGCLRDMNPHKPLTLYYTDFCEGVN